MRRTLICSTLLMTLAGSVVGQQALQKDTVKTDAGDLVITLIGHGTLMFEIDGAVVHVDPFSRLADYATLPKADLIAVTHGHPDHLDPKAIAQIRTEQTVLVTNAACAKQLEGATVMKNGDVQTLAGFKIEAVPAYNLEKSFHPKGRDNGYIFTFGGKRVYVAGDTEYVPEMQDLGNIDIAFLPMNLPYTMTPEMAAEAAKAIQPTICYPYHTGNTDVAKFAGLLEEAEGIEVRIRDMK